MPAPLTTRFITREELESALREHGTGVESIEEIMSEVDINKVRLFFLFFFLFSSEMIASNIRIKRLPISSIVTNNLNEHVDFQDGKINYEEFCATMGARAELEEDTPAS